MRKNNLRNPILLFITATIWGTAFVAQSVATDFIGPFTFNGLRCILGGAVLLPVIAILDTGKKRRGQEICRWGNRKLLIGGLLCGVILCVASNLQQFGIAYTTAGKAGFITAFYIVIVPVLSIFLGKKTNIITWISVAVALVGLYLLCIKEGFTVSIGDLLIFLCAIGFAVHILVIDHFSPLVDGVKMSCIQFFTCGFISLVVMLFTEKPDSVAILGAWMPLLYAGVMSCGVAYTLQIVGQNGVNPTLASLILSLESVIAVLAGWLLLHEAMSVKELFGCVLVFGAIILVQLKPSDEAR